MPYAEFIFFSPRVGGTSRMNFARRTVKGDATKKTSEDDFILPPDFSPFAENDGPDKRHILASEVLTTLINLQNEVLNFDGVDTTDAYRHALEIFCGPIIDDYEFTVATFTEMPQSRSRSNPID